MGWAVACNPAGPKWWHPHEGEGALRSRHRTKSGWVPVAVVLTISALLLSACTGDGEPDTEAADTDESAAAADEPGQGEDVEPGDGGDGSPSEIIDVRWGSDADPSQAGLRDAVIKDRDLDSRHGLNLEVTALAPDEAEPAVLTGQVDVGFLPLTSWANAVVEGEDLVVLDLTSHNDGALLVRSESEFATVEDLRGGTIASLDPMSNMYTSTQVVLSRMGIGWPDEFEVVSAAPSGLSSYIHSGEADAIVQLEPYVCQLLAVGHYRVIFGLDEQWQELTGNWLPLTGLVAKRSWLDENPGVADRIRAMARDLGSTISENPEIIAEYADLLELEDDAGIDCAQERMAPQYTPFSEEESVETARQFLDTAVDEGIIGGHPDEIFVWE